MSRLRAARRNKLPKSDFGLPGERKYPMPDKEHARVAKSYASKEEHRGTLSSGQEAEIDRKADRVLGKRSGGGRGHIMESHGGGEAPRNDAAGFERGARGDEGPQFGGSKRTDLDPARGSGSGSESANGSDGAGRGGSHGRGGIASHSNMSHMHDDTPMFRGRKY